METKALVGRYERTGIKRHAEGYFRLNTSLLHTLESFPQVSDKAPGRSPKRLQFFEVLEAGGYATGGGFTPMLAAYRQKWITVSRLIFARLHETIA